MIRRAPLVEVADVDGLLDLVREAPVPVTLIVDVDNTLVRQGAPPEEFVPVVEAAIDRLESAAGVDRVLVLSNGADRAVPRMVSRGHKPWTTRRRLGLTDPGSNVVVVGDQVLTDGLLAWRLGAVYARLVVDTDSESGAQGRMRRAGDVLAPVFLRPSPGDLWV